MLDVSYITHLADEIGFDDQQAIAMLGVAAAIGSLAEAIQRLGNNDAATSMGAIENLAKEVKEGLGSIAESLEQLPQP